MEDKEFKTYWNHNHVIKLREKLFNWDIDPNIASRRENHKCKYCFYISYDRVVMPAFSHNHCKECKKEMVFANSNVNKYCPECAQKLGVCRHCGAEMD